MKAIPWRTPLGAVAAGYAVVVFIAAVLLLGRHIQYVTHAADANSYGAMFAFGDLLLGLFIGGLFLIPTLFLVLVIRKSEGAYTRYSQTLLGLSLTAPISLEFWQFPPWVKETPSWVGSVWTACSPRRSSLRRWWPAVYWPALAVRSA